MKVKPAQPLPTKQRRAQGVGPQARRLPLLVKEDNVKQYILVPFAATTLFVCTGCFEPESTPPGTTSSSSSGTGGQGGAPAECATADDCDAPTCQLPHCTDGLCHYSATLNGSSCTDDANQAGRCSYGHCVPNVHCTADVDCDGVQRALCHDVPCYNGICDDVLTPLGGQCQNSGNPSDICDGRGNCGQWMPYGGPACYAPNPLSFSVCPTCDDADPTTRDACVLMGGLMQCTHDALPDMHECGPWYTMQGGKCCPVPETIPQ